MISFSNGRWISIILPKLIDLHWSKKDVQFYATIYTAALEKHTDTYACILAEIAVNKRLYPELKYDKTFENALNSLYE